jgi:hypothetical protein
MKLLLISILSLLYSLTSAQTQYPFERFKKIKFKSDEFKRDSIGPETFMFSAQLEKYKIVLQEAKDRDSTTISIYNSGKLSQEFKENVGFLEVTLEEDLQTADINGDGYEDIKVTVYNNGSGLAGSLVTKIYLFGSKKGFIKLSFMDFACHSEVDMNRDGNYEIIGCYLASYKKHNYWTFDLYNYDSGKFVNVSRKFAYPIMIQNLYRENYEITKKISRVKMRDFSTKEPGRIRN